MTQLDQTFLLIFGPPAVGKMTVAYEIAHHTGFKVFHNHMSIELLLPFFEFGSPAFNRLNDTIRMGVFNEVATSAIQGFIFTFVWALDLESEKEYVDHILSIFESKGWKTCFVELQADFDERLVRNKSEFRLSQKPSKRNIEASQARLKSGFGKYKCNSNEDFFYPHKHLKLMTTDMSASQVARQAIKHFNLMK